ncbi:TetR family transcriptional regulator [Candidatus Frankia alpina]|uniref:acyl-CoA-like ligand-binding transcription factor n=1 Tax=Candidatus Frankia alpina TaxID=2699483 RepID=UPI0013D1FA16|nr:TetR family transcriptional regulator [Candidatus Frankia alpina]
MAGARNGPRGAGRPRVTSPEAVEQVAIQLLLREGYANVSVDQIAAAAGVGRTTFFRYFPSKAAVVWSAFDHANRRLAELLARADGACPPMTAVREAVVGSTRDAVDTRGVWLERFRLLDTSTALRANAAEHWETWRATVAAFIAHRIGAASQDVVPTAIAGAVQGTYIAELRSWLLLTTTTDDLLERLRRSLTTVGDVLDTLTAPPRGADGASSAPTSGGR